MKKIKLAFKFLLPILMPVTLLAQDTVVLKQQANLYAEATVKRNYETVVDYFVYPGIIQMYGSKLQMAYVLARKNLTDRLNGYMFQKIDIGSSGKYYKAGSQVFCIIPEYITTAVFNGRVLHKTDLLAVSDNKGKSWFFIPIDANAIKLIPQLFPNFNRDLKIPEPDPMADSLPLEKASPTTVLSDFATLPNIRPNEMVATFGGTYFVNICESMLELKGVSEVLVGYSGGYKEYPTIKEVESNSTGHAECVQIYYNPNIINFAGLVKAFFAAHEAGIDHSGPDYTGKYQGTAFRSIAFYRTAEEKRVLDSAITKYDENRNFDFRCTQVAPFSIFYPAEKNLQHYYRQDYKTPSVESDFGSDVESFRRVMNDKLKTEFQSSYDPRHPDGIVGYWQILNFKTSNELEASFQNKYVELHKNGVVILRNEQFNSTKNVRFLHWAVKVDTIIFVTSTDPSNHVANYCLFNLHNDLLTVKSFKSISRGRNSIVTSAVFDISLKKLSDNPFVRYKEILPAEKVIGSWQQEIIVRNSGMYDDHFSYYDIHPATNDIGEMVFYTNKNGSKTVPYDSLYFIKYLYTFNGTFQFKKTLDQVDASGRGLMQQVMNTVDLGNAKAYFYAFNYMNADYQLKFNCYFSDGIIIMDKLLESETLYSVKNGPLIWPDGNALHQAYNANNSSGITLQRFGIHWESCPKCGGTGKVDVVEGHEETVIIDPSSGLKSTKWVPTSSSMCPVCNGVGGFYVNDITGKRL